MKKTLIPLLIGTLLLTGCSLLDRFKTNSSSFSSGSSQSSENSDSSLTSSSDGGGNSSGTTTSSNGGSSSSSNGGSSSENGEEQTALEQAEDLGIMSISNAKTYILNHKPTLNSHEIGVDYTHKITIRGYALSKFDLVKTKKSFGLDVSYPAKTLLGDGSGYLACASTNPQASSAGIALYGKVGDHCGEDTSRYEVTGFPSIYLGQPELCIPDRSFEWKQTLDITRDIESYSKETIDLPTFFDYCKDVKYNCAGHGYGEAFRINSLTCHYVDSDYSYMTDGQRLIKILTNKSMSISKGSVYDVIGTLSTYNYQPALRAMKLISSASAPVALDYSTYAEELNCTNLLKIKTSQDDTDTRYDSFVLSFNKVYKADVYMGEVLADVDSQKYDVVFTDAYKGTTPLESGRDTCGVNGAIFVSNDYFWGETQAKIQTKNGYSVNGANKIFANETVTVYYIPQIIRYVSKKPIWKVFLLPETIPSVS